MLSLQGITDLLNDNRFKTEERIINWRKVYYGMSLHIRGIMPRFYDMRYPEARTWYYPQTASIWHAEYQAIFELYHYSRHPREAEETRNWRLSQYRPLTKDPFQRAIQVITGAIFQDSGYGLNFTNEDDKDYIWGNNFDKKDFIGFITAHFQNICEDPNGVFLVIPKRPASQTGERVEPDIKFVCSRHIIWHTDDEIIFEDRDIRWAVNKFGYFRFEKVDKKWVNIDGVSGFYYAHMLRNVPVIIAGGLWNTQGYYDSWLDAAKPIADEFIGGKSAEQLVNKEASHPFIVEVDSECPECHGAKQIQVHCSCEDGCDRCSNGWILGNCGTCGGQGVISHNPGQRILAPAQDMGSNLVQIINPDINVNKFHTENNANIFKAILSALHLNYIEQAQSGTAKDKDMETRYQFISRISNDLFDRLIPELLNNILGLRNVTVIDESIAPYTPQYTIVKPSQFQIKTSQDLLDELKAAQDSKIPAYQLGALLEDFTDKQFGGNDVLKKKTSIINQMDILANLTTGDIQIYLTNGLVTLRVAQLHTYLPSLLDAIVRDRGNDWFLNATYDEIKALVDQMFAIAVPPAITVRPEIIDENRV